MLQVSKLTIPVGISRKRFNDYNKTMSILNAAEEMRGFKVVGRYSKNRKADESVIRIPWIVEY